MTTRVRGHTAKSDLAVRAYRLLYLDREPRATRRFILESRLHALLRVLDADETAWYYRQTAIVGGPPGVSL